MERTREKLVDLGRDRCPFCHDSVEPDASVACQDCLARHHLDCWDESGSCSSCGALERLEPKGRAPLDMAQAKQVLAAAGYARPEIEAVLSRSEPGRGPRKMPLTSPFRLEVVGKSGLTLRWSHHAKFHLWFTRLVSLIVLPLLPILALIQPTVWMRATGQLVLGKDRLLARGLFRGPRVMGWPRDHEFTRDRLRLDSSLRGTRLRKSLMLSDGEKTLFLVGPEEAAVMGMRPEVTEWLEDLLQAWRAGQLQDWLPHL